MTLKRNSDGEQVVTLGPTEKIVFAVVTTLIASGIIAIISMAMETKSDIAALKADVRSIDRRVERIEDGK